MMVLQSDPRRTHIIGPFHMLGPNLFSVSNKGRKLGMDNLTRIRKSKPESNRRVFFGYKFLLSEKIGTEKNRSK